MIERAQRLIDFCEDVGWSADETRGAVGQALVMMLNRECDSRHPSDRYYHVYQKGGHDLWLHEKEPLIIFDMSEPPMMRRGVPLPWVKEVIEVASRARDILIADRSTLALEGKVIRIR